MKTIRKTGKDKRLLHARGSSSCIMHRDAGDSPRNVNVSPFSLSCLRL